MSVKVDMGVGLTEGSQWGLHRLQDRWWNLKAKSEELDNKIKNRLKPDEKTGNPELKDS